MESYAVELEVATYMICLLACGPPYCRIQGFDDSPSKSSSRSHLYPPLLLYVHSILPHDPITIPPSFSLPILRVSAELQLPPTMSYSDDVLHNCKLKTPSSGYDVPTIDNLRCQTSFTGSADEEGFYLASRASRWRSPTAYPGDP